MTTLARNSSRRRQRAHGSSPLAAALADARVDRRGFLTFAAKGLAIAFTLPLVGRAAACAMQRATPKRLADAYVHIGTDGSITLSFGGAEMGQGSMSGLAQILAEELVRRLDQITVVQQELVDPVVSYFTGGSSAVRGATRRLRNAGAAARELLIAAAMAQNGDANRDNYTAQSAVVTHCPAERSGPTRRSSHSRGVDAGRPPTCGSPIPPSSA